MGARRQQRARRRQWSMAPPLTTAKEERDRDSERERAREGGSGGRERNGLGEPGLRSVVVGEAGPAQPGFVPPHARVTLANA